MTEHELRPCPFCGSAGKLYCHELDARTTIWWVQCQRTRCLARRLAADSRAAAVAAWNCRKGAKSAWIET